MNLNPARLFRYTRELEQQCGAASDRIDELEHQAKVERERASHHIDFLREAFEEERKERRYLQDRLCQILRLPPIYEASPGEAERRAASGGAATIRPGPRQAAIQAG